MAPDLTEAEVAELIAKAPEGGIEYEFARRLLAEAKLKRAEAERDALKGALALHTQCRTDISIGDLLRIADGVHRALHPTDGERADGDLPGMWEAADLIGGATDAEEAATDRVRERLDALIADGFGATTDTLRALRADLDRPTEETAPGLVVRPDDVVVIHPNHYDDRLFVYGRDIAVVHPTDTTEETDR